MLSEATATKMTGEYLFTQGILGVLCFVLASVVAFLYRQNMSQRKEFDDSLVAERTRHNAEFLAERNRHAVEIAAERKLNAELQDERVTELKSSLATVASVTDTMDKALIVISGRN